MNKMKSQEGLLCCEEKEVAPLIQNPKVLWCCGISGRDRIGFGWKWLYRGRGSPDLRNKVNIY